MMIASIALVSLCLVETGTSTSLRTTDKKESFGAVVGPAALPGGATSAYAFIGLPEVGAGFRQGLSFGEWEARARVDYLTLSFIGELIGKYALYHWERLDYGPYLGAGITFSSGARYYDPLAFSFVGVRVLGGATLSYQVLDTLRLLARLEVPFERSFSAAGGGRLRALAGGGAELYLADDITVMALGEAGVDWIKLPLAPTVARLGYSVMLGFGLRLF